MRLITIYEGLLEDRWEGNPGLGRYDRDALKDTGKKGEEHMGLLYMPFTGFAERGHERLLCIRHGNSHAFAEAALYGSAA